MPKKVDAISMTDLNHISIFIIVFFGISFTVRVIYNSIKPLMSNPVGVGAGAGSGALNLSSAASVEGFGNQSGQSVAQYVQAPHARRGVVHGHNSVNLDDDDTSDEDDDGDNYDETDSDDTSDDNSDDGDGAVFANTSAGAGGGGDNDDDDDDEDTDTDSDDDEDLKKKKREYREERRRERNSFAAKYDRMVSRRLTRLLGTPEEREKTKGDLKRLVSMGADNLRRRIKHWGATAPQ